MEYYIYILFSDSLQQFYTGSTQDLAKRLNDHNNGWSKHTSKGVPWKLVYTKVYEGRTEALKAENNIKKRGAKRFLEQATG
ncbi:GIY-YIG nuclease family protein [Segetibacter sp. 3557_3]|uniref:GIY-YIG nuclease family protein n=1 Tax=Segetibacter sp. 3557_3 TaxID=2547429 RepID=UPI00105846F3|nr:GIY-YIG nuclease family protein [Segetibacter sp. 3557_3]TDH26121.1 GIY-YIG nuclease family protein [Segetibacter sp. 3557_3]